MDFILELNQYLEFLDPVMAYYASINNYATQKPNDIIQHKVKS